MRTPTPPSERHDAGRPIVLAAELFATLEAEFEALRSQQLDRLSPLQDAKEILLTRLNAMATAKDDASDTAPPDGDYRQLIARCRDAHQRNETLVRHQLTAIRGALEALQPRSPLPAADVYDRTGRIKSITGSITELRG